MAGESLLLHHRQWLRGAAVVLAKAEDGIATSLARWDGEEDL